MNAPLQISEASALGDIDDFFECCEQQAWFYAEGWVSLQTAVDNLQYLAERWLLIEQHGQDAIQALMAFSAVSEELPSDYAAQTVQQLELNDPRDAWCHTGEPAPPGIVRNSDVGIPTSVAKQPYRTPRSTVDAFRFLVALGDTERLKSWLADRAKDAPFLLALLEGAATC
jgi:hypothetical protein